MRTLSTWEAAPPSALLRKTKSKLVTLNKNWTLNGVR
jgi:hypothetical protein